MPLSLHVQSCIGDAAVFFYNIGGSQTRIGTSSCLSTVQSRVC